jgi:hypothetical protein
MVTESVLPENVAVSASHLTRCEEAIAIKKTSNIGRIRSAVSGLRSASMIGLLVDAEKIQGNGIPMPDPGTRDQPNLAQKLFQRILLVFLDTAEEKRGHPEQGNFHRTQTCGG